MPSAVRSLALRLLVCLLLCECADRHESIGCMHATVYARHPLNYRFNFHSKSNVPSVGVEGSDKIALIPFNPFATVSSYNQAFAKTSGWGVGGGRSQTLRYCKWNVQVVSRHKPPYKATDSSNEIWTAQCHKCHRVEWKKCIHYEVSLSKKKSNSPSCLRMRSHDHFRNTSSSYFSVLCNSLPWLRASIHAENTWNNQMCTCSLSGFFLFFFFPFLLKNKCTHMHDLTHTRTQTHARTRTHSQHRHDILAMWSR